MARVWRPCVLALMSAVLCCDVRVVFTTCHRPWPVGCLSLCEQLSHLRSMFVAAPGIDTLKEIHTNDSLHRKRSGIPKDDGASPDASANIVAECALGSSLAHPHVCLSIHASIYPSIHLFIYPSIARHLLFAACVLLPSLQRLAVAPAATTRRCPTRRL